MLKLAAVSVLLITACAPPRQQPDTRDRQTEAASDLDILVNELGSLLDGMSGDDGNPELLQIVERIDSQARELATEHRTFVNRFDRLLSDRNASEAELGQLINAYADRRTFLRNSLLASQDQLHRAMTPEEWGEVINILNKSSQSIADQTMTGG